MCKHINYDALPRNFQDAVTFTRQMGYKYVWIDSLCIKQHCSEDWEHEADKMAMVYAQSVCTISSSGSSGSDEGCFHSRNFLWKYPCNLLSSEQMSLTVSVDKSTSEANHIDAFTAQVDNGPLSLRAWTFQERLLSPRIIHFGHAHLFFECNTYSASELQPIGIKYEGQRVLPVDMQSDFQKIAMRIDNTEYYPRGITPSNSNLPMKYARAIRRSRPQPKRQRNPKYFPRKKAEAEYRKTSGALFNNSMLGYRAAFDSLRETLQNTPQPTEFTPLLKNSMSPRKQLRLHQRWFKLVTMFSSRQLTVSTDRLTAIKAVAKAIMGDKNEQDYHYGLWKHHFLFDLLWYLHDIAKPRPPYRAPSWSWGAVDGMVDQRLLKLTDGNESSVFEVKWIAIKYDFGTAEFNLRTESATERVDRPFLDLKCRMAPVIDIMSNGDLQAEGSEGPFHVTFSKQSILPDPIPKLFCAGIMRVAGTPNFEYLVRPMRFWGIVLQIADSATSVGGGPLCYERVGIFWTEQKSVNTTQFQFMKGPFAYQEYETVRII
jgi:hypothetical protein